MADKTRTLKDIEQEIEALSALSDKELNPALYALCVELLTPKNPIIRMATKAISKRIRTQKRVEWRQEATEIRNNAQCLVLGDIAYYGGTLIYIGDTLYVMDTVHVPNSNPPEKVLCFSSKDCLLLEEIKERLSLLQGILKEAALKKFFPVPTKT